MQSRRDLVPGFSRVETIPSPEVPSQLPRSSTLPGWLVPVGIVFIASIVMLLVGLGGLLLSARGDVDSLTTQIAVLDATAKQHEADPACRDVSNDREAVSALLAKGDLVTAAGLAQNALVQVQGTTPLCSEPKLALAKNWYDTQLQLLLATQHPSWPDDSFDRQIVARWQEIERSADSYQLPATQRQAPIVLARTASGVGLWALSDASFRRAWSTQQPGTAPAADRYALLRNWGHQLAEDGGPDQRDRAIRLLATACWIGKAYELPGDEARADMEQYFGIADCSAVVPDQDDPLLVAASDVKAVQR